MSRATASHMISNRLAKIHDRVQNTEEMAWKLARQEAEASHFCHNAKRNQHRQPISYQNGSTKVSVQ